MRVRKIPPLKMEGEQRLLAYGTYNCAILQNDDRVFRVMAVPRGWENLEKAVTRAGEMLLQFRRMKHALGPAVLRELKRGEWLDPEHLDPEVRQWLEALPCPPLANARPLEDYRLYAQTIEYAEGRDLVRYLTQANATGDTHGIDGQLGDAVAFIIMWFFYVAQAQFGFRHRDVKPQNIVMRTYPEPVTFRFELGGWDQFEITTDRVPVIIDLDFGSFYTTDETVRQQDGTVFFMPMEVALDLLIGQDVTQPTHGDAVDWYSIGATLLMYWCRPDRHQWYRAFGVEQGLVEHYELEVTERRLGAAQAMCFHAVVAIYLKLPLPRDLIVASRTIGLIDTPQARYLGEQIERIRLETPDRIQLLRALLAPVAKDRYANGEPWRLLTEQPLFSKFRQRCSWVWRPVRVCESGLPPSKIFRYGKHPVLENLPRDQARFKDLVAALRAMPAIAALCGTCSERASSVCTCCDVPFCDVRCQRAAHK